MSSTGRRRPSRTGLLRVRRPAAENTAFGIYGVIVGAAVMVAAHGESAAGVAGWVLATLLIYWAAERYSRLVAERIHEHHRPSWSHVRQQLTSGWEIVTASTLPLAVLLITKNLGAKLSVAVLSALICSTVLLCLAGWEIGRHGQLTLPERLASAAVAGAFGAVMIGLKAWLH